MVTALHNLLLAAGDAWPGLPGTMVPAMVPAIDSRASDATQVCPPQSMPRAWFGMPISRAAVAQSPAEGGWPSAMSERDLVGHLKARFQDDLSGVCVVAAVVQGDNVVRARYCAKPRADGGPPLDALFEIGSVSKTMTAFLVAKLIMQGRWALEDPIVQHLPPGTEVPRQREREIQVQHLVTHSSCLHARLPLDRGNPGNPYARLSEKDLLASLAEAELTGPIGSRPQYSNFGMMVLSLAVAHAYGGCLDKAFKEHLFDPLGMTGACISTSEPGQPLAAGHSHSGTPVPAWTVAANLAGSGMVRATLDDMVKYAQAQSGAMEDPLSSCMRMTQLPRAHGYGMNWMHKHFGGRDVVQHEGGTGGFSSIVAFEPLKKHAVVILADTALADVGGLGDLALSLLGLDISPGTPRTERPVPQKIREAIEGEYSVAGRNICIWSDESQLMIRGKDLPPLAMLFDSHGDFHPAALGALITPVEVVDGSVQRFTWRQGGQTLEGVRQDSPVTAHRFAP